MVIILLSTHIYMTAKTGVIQRKLPLAIKLSVKKKAQPGGIGQFALLASSLASTIGTGNILGVGTAIVLGGPGAVFWIWISGIFAIATKYAETLIGIKYCDVDENGERHGGAMYTLKNKLHSKFLANIFAVFAAASALGLGCSLQSNAISAVMQNNFLQVNPLLVKTFVGVILSVLSAMVIFGGVKSITKVCEFAVPVMAALYILGCAAVLIINYNFVLPAISLIFKSAFGANPIVSGFLGYGIIRACRYGVSRGLFSNEAGVGSSPIISAKAKDNIVETSLVAASGTFWDTVVICMITGITMVTGIISLNICPKSGDLLAAQTFSQIPIIGKGFLTVVLTAFAFSTILGWCIYGEQSFCFLFGNKFKNLFRVLWIAVVFFSAYAQLDTLWNIADIINALMAIPNIYSMVLLSKVIKSDTSEYFRKKL